MNTIINFIKELLFPNKSSNTPIGLSQFKYTKEKTNIVQKPKAQDVSLTELMRKTAH